MSIKFAGVCHRRIEVRACAGNSRIDAATLYQPHRHSFTNVVALLSRIVNLFFLRRALEFKDERRTK